MQGDHEVTQGFAGSREQALRVLNAESSLFSPTEPGVRSGLSLPLNQPQGVRLPRAPAALAPSASKTSKKQKGVRNSRP